jgi:beta-lactamase superfamily II metal-dependent hydrolase
MRPILALLVLCLVPAFAAQRKTLDIYFVDVEGGQATLLVTPAGESLLVDAGWPGNNNRDAERIIAAAKHAGLKQIDYLLMTHYHLDHVGGVAGLAALFPVKAIIDHGENTESGRQAAELSASYQKALAAARHVTVKAGDLLPLKGVRIEVLAARGVTVPAALPGAGKSNPLCAGEARKPDDASENARSVGVLVTFGKFRFLDLADLTWNKELELACPVNKIGTVDLYLTNHHGLDQSNPRSLVHAVAPRVAVMNNGLRKGGSPPAWQIISSAPGLQDLWQLHFSQAGGTANNVPPERIANPEGDPGHYILVAAEKNRKMTVTNSRTGQAKKY